MPTDNNTSKHFSKARNIGVLATFALLSVGIVSLKSFEKLVRDLVADFGDGAAGAVIRPFQYRDFA